MILQIDFVKEQLDFMKWQQQSETDYQINPKYIHKKEHMHIMDGVRGEELSEVILQVIENVLYKSSPSIFGFFPSRIQTIILEKFDKHAEFDLEPLFEYKKDVSCTSTSYILSYMIMQLKNLKLTADMLSRIQKLHVSRNFGMD